MQTLAVFAALLGMGAGFAARGFAGAATGAVVPIAVGSGLAIARGERGTSLSSDRHVRLAQRIGGILVAGLSSAGAYAGGWTWGWALAGVGYVAGTIVAVLGGVLLRRTAVTGGAKPEVTDPSRSATDPSSDDDPASSALAPAVPLLMYNDDRLFVLDVNVAERGAFQGHTSTVLAGHIDPTKDLVWTVTTRRNVRQLPPVRVDQFDTLVEALDFVREIEPQTPRRSLRGESPSDPTSYNDYLTWLGDHGLAGAIETKINSGGYHRHPDWAEKMRWEAGLIARHLGIVLPSWD